MTGSGFDMATTFACLCGSRWFYTQVVVHDRTKTIAGWNQRLTCRSCGNEIDLTGQSTG